MMLKNSQIRIYSLVLIIVLFISLIGILIKLEYEDLHRLEFAAMESHFKDQVLETKRSSELLKLFVNDINGLSRNQVLDTYFSNLDLGMSEKYGLKYSRFQIKKEFSEFLKLQEVDGTPFYRQIVLIDEKGNEIVSSVHPLADSTDIYSPEFSEIRTRVLKVGKLHGFMQEYSYSILYCNPIIYKGQYRGKILTFINNPAFFPDKHMSASNITTILLLPGFEESNYKEGIHLRYSLKEFPPLDSFKTNKFKKVTVKTIYGSIIEVVVSRINVEGTDFEILNICPIKYIYRNQEKLYYTITIIVLSLIIIIGAVLVERFHLKNSNLKVQLQTRAEQNASIRRKNEEMQAEIAKRKLIEEELSESRIKAEYLANESEQANRSKSLFLANMSHDIRTPMNSIIGFTDILLETIKDEQNNEFLRHIKSSADYLLNIINDVLDISKIESGSQDVSRDIINTKEFFLNVDNLFIASAEEKGLRFQGKLNDDLPEFFISDSQKLKQVLVNLLNNAIKFTHNGAVVYHVSCANNVMDISVSDTGIGIPKEFHSDVFEPFKQVKGQNHSIYGGTGLGLAITKRLVDLMRGEITFSTEVGVGTTFYIELPIDIPDSVNIEKEDEQSEITVSVVKPLHILIAEDNHINQRLIGFLIGSAQHTFDIVPNGLEALKKLKMKHYDLLLLDIQMPVMDGYETLKRIRGDKDLKDLYVIALTAQAMSGDKENLIEQGANDYVSKPINKFKLLESINHFASRRL
ncbi:MAG: response regulator [Candidatus Cloacimonetes bacterium]|nr:response regulator [Candidatus Cloacimonadota bacterium]